MELVYIVMELNYGGVMSLISIANASEVAGATVGTGSSLMSLLPMVLIFAIFYFFLIRPQVKKQRATEAMIAELKKGDRVIAAGGIYGVIHKIEGNVVYLEIADNVRIKALKTSVTESLSKDEKTEAAVEKQAEVKKLDKKSNDDAAEKPAKASTLEGKPKTKKSKK